ncbi:N-acetylmuramidase family protein [Algoriphagus lutimaris]|uniref:N-acetylmuramidase domain-containing protein n=1 Tax=Algoriphagus lutimaris TaxID=613197 RepID=UPI00196A5668|nr:N-acetylmuramidase family protein [Algoriphagus lutimaris]MBN3519142.1 N-acetylmuramidase family protein [Algoriphagus lutimaris]
MQSVKYKSRGPTVSFLQEILGKLGFQLPNTGYFGLETDQAVKEFQSKNNLVVDGKVGVKTWTLLLAKANPNHAFGNKFLGEQDLMQFAQQYGLELSCVKAVNEVESSGRGFLINGMAKILFEGHVFWRQLEARGIDPSELSNIGNQDILYKKWTKKFYLSGTREYDRLEKAINLGPDPRIKSAALSSASWGSFQIMGYHATKLGYPSVEVFVDEMQIHERNHLEAFGRYLKTYGCLQFLKEKNWAGFANCYNGSGFAENKYDVKLAAAYEKYS